MFEQELSDKFKKIFGVKKVTYDFPSDMKEQECLWVEVTKSTPAFKDKRACLKVEGNVIMFANAEKLPFGFFSKALSQADFEDTKNLVVMDQEENTRSYRNIVQRGFSFVYFFSSQYDPKVGTITSVETTVTEE